MHRSIPFRQCHHILEYPEHICWQGKRNENCLEMFITAALAPKFPNLWKVITLEKGLLYREENHTQIKFSPSILQWKHTEFLQRFLVKVPALEMQLQINLDASVLTVGIIKPVIWSFCLWQRYHVLSLLSEFVVFYACLQNPIERFSQKHFNKGGSSPNLETFWRGWRYSQLSIY